MIRFTVGVAVVTVLPTESCTSTSTAGAIAVLVTPLED